MIKCAVEKCPKGIISCCQFCQGKEFCEFVCECKTHCEYQETHDPAMDNLKLQRKHDRQMKKSALIIKIILILAMLILGVIVGQLSEVKTMQTDTLNTLMDTERQIDDLSKENSQVEQVYQNEEKNATRGNYERASTCLGDFTITYYCGCEKCCGKTDKITKLGTVAEAGRTVGADWNVLQPGTKIYIDGIGERVVEDTGGGIQGNHIDVYVDSHQEAINLGKTTRKVYEVM